MRAVTCAFGAALNLGLGIALSTATSVRAQIRERRGAYIGAMLRRSESNSDTAAAAVATQIFAVERDARVTGLKYVSQFLLAG